MFPLKNLACKGLKDSPRSYDKIYSGLVTNIPDLICGGEITWLFHDVPITLLDAEDYLAGIIHYISMAPPEANTRHCWYRPKKNLLA